MPIHSLATTPSATPTLPPSLLRLHVPRHNPSPLYAAAQTLSHAVGYLVSEQVAGRRPSLSANREAIAILAVAARHLHEAERRRPAKASIAAWLRGASLSRALHHQAEDTSVV